MYVAVSDGSGYRVLSVSKLVAESAFQVKKEVTCTVEITDTTHPLVVIPCTREPEKECDFRMRFESEKPLSVQPVDPQLQYRM
jgi:hypothetical protein